MRPEVRPKMGYWLFPPPLASRPIELSASSDPVAGRPSARLQRHVYVPNWLLAHGLYARSAM